jgi:AcrR family transcriptional regulator
MPKVTEEHQEARRGQILQAACKCFTEKGLHKTTMRDICREAGLSAGAVYGYFESKEQLVEGMAALGRRNTRAFIEANLTDDTAPRSLAHLFRAVLRFIDSPEGLESSRLDVGLWGEGLHSPRIGELLRQNRTSVSELVSEIVRAGQERNEVDARLDPENVSRICVALVLGLQVQKAMHPEVDLKGCSRVISSLLTGGFNTEDREG